MNHTAIDKLRQFLIREVDSRTHIHNRLALDYLEEVLRYSMPKAEATELLNWAREHAVVVVYETAEESQVRCLVTEPSEQASRIAAAING